MRDGYDKLVKVRKNLLDRYQEEFLGTLIAQAVDRKDRYYPVEHKTLRTGDIVLIKEINTKPHKYPLGVIKKTLTNDIGEVTGAIVMKGKTRELVKRHSSTLIPMLRDPNNESEVGDFSIDDACHSKIEKGCPGRPLRKAAMESRLKTKVVLGDEL